MTTIACNLKEMACDLQFTKGYQKFKGSSKILEVTGERAKELFGYDKVLLGMSGSAADLGKMNRYLFGSGEKLDPIKESDMLLLTKDGIYTSTNFKDWAVVDAKHFAIGSGSQYALGALANKVSPEEAVKVACKHDIYSGMGTKLFKL